MAFINWTMGGVGFPWHSNFFSHCAPHAPWPTGDDAPAPSNNLIGLERLAGAAFSQGLLTENPSPVALERLSGLGSESDNSPGV